MARKTGICKHKFIVQLRCCMIIGPCTILSPTKGRGWPTVPFSIVIFSELSLVFEILDMLNKCLAYSRVKVLHILKFL